MPAPSISPPPQGVATSAAGADQLALSQGLLGRLGRTDDDHRVLRCARPTSVVYHVLARKGPTGVAVRGIKPIAKTGKHNK